ncbi:hypothetical protein KP509_38G020500 [Ceratopteris richardii]|uniref:HVA22-like protein n=1 Tax=Ceratopteris richardii TaxID=49495 RepID=A0A8T2Q2C6_CERRI|nr:hypothetical protein KP509_38G020500 [Ceratopteris richardii]
MIGSFITRATIMLFGYAYPAYECFKIVEKNRADFERLQFWCKYWMIIAILTMLERLGDAFISWLPMYNEAKLAFIIYLWYPKTEGTTYVYSTFLKPFVANYERDIDQHLNELRTRAGDLTCQYLQKGSVYAQTRLMEALQYVASQSSSTTQQGANTTNKEAPSSYSGRRSPSLVKQRSRSSSLDRRPFQVDGEATAQQHRSQEHSSEDDVIVMDTDELLAVPETGHPVRIPRTRGRQRVRGQQ